MKIELQDDGTWLAVGNGPTRRIVAEGETREDARIAFVIQCGIQNQRVTDMQRRTDKAIKQSKIDRFTYGTNYYHQMEDQL